VTVELIQEDPKPSGRARRSELREWLDALREEGSGQWFKYAKPMNPGNTTSIKQGGYGAKPGEFEATSRVLELDRSLGKAYIFARLVKVPAQSRKKPVR
jgi:hypothetical protein